MRGGVVGTALQGVVGRDLPCWLCGCCRACGSQEVVPQQPATKTPGKNRMVRFRSVWTRFHHAVGKCAVMHLPGGLQTHCTRCA